MGLPLDTIYDVLEGLVPYTIKLMLYHFIEEEKLFKLANLNHIVTNFDYGYLESTSKLSQIQVSTLYSSDKTNLVQSGMLLSFFFSFVASQMWSFAGLLQIMIGCCYVPKDSDHWLHYLQLLEIMDYTFAPVVCRDAPGYL